MKKNERNTQTKSIANKSFLFNKADNSIKQIKYSNYGFCKNNRVAKCQGIDLDKANISLRCPKAPVV